MQRYEVKRSPYSSHSLVARILGTGNGKSLLDVGCAAGEVSVQLASQGWKVTGIEPFGPDANVAANRGLSVIEGTAEDVIPKLDATFDAVLLADVLEHCADPWAQLKLVTSVCAPGAHVVISIPNVAHVSIRAQLASGRFQYTDKGILDRTHLRFFTRSSVVELVEQSGLEVRKMLFTPAPIELVHPGMTVARVGRTALALNASLARAIPGVFAYQFVMLCTSSASNQSE